MRAESLGRVVAGLTSGDEERPVARFEEQQLAERVIRGALAERIAGRIVGDGTYARCGIADRVPHPLSLRSDPRRMVVVLAPRAFGERDPLARRLRLESMRDGGRDIAELAQHEAKPVDASKIKCRELSELRPGGLGTFIIGQVFDEVKYEPAGRGTMLTLRKHLP